MLFVFWNYIIDNLGPLYTPLDMVFSAAYNVFTIDVMSYQVKMLMFCNVQKTNLTFVGKGKWDVQ